MITEEKVLLAFQALERNEIKKARKMEREPFEFLQWLNLQDSYLIDEVDGVLTLVKPDTLTPKNDEIPFAQGRKLYLEKLNEWQSKN